MKNELLTQSIALMGFAATTLWSRMTSSLWWLMLANFRKILLQDFS